MKDSFTVCLLLLLFTETADLKMSFGSIIVVVVYDWSCRSGKKKKKEDDERVRGAGTTAGSQKQGSQAANNRERVQRERHLSGKSKTEGKN